MVHADNQLLTFTHTDVIRLFDASQPLVVATHASLGQSVRLYH